MSTTICQHGRVIALSCVEVLEHDCKLKSANDDLLQRLMLQTRDQLSIPMHQVDAHNVVPVWDASDKKETAARTIRKKIHTKLPGYLTVIQTPHCASTIQ